MKTDLSNHPGHGLTVEEKREIAEHVLYGLHSVAFSIRNQARRGELVLDEYLATVCSLRDGKIDTIHTYLSDVDMVNAFFTD